MTVISHSPSIATWVLVCGGFHELGGMDRANYALALKLLEQGRKVFLVGHQIDQRLLNHPNVTPSIVPRPFGSTLLGERALDQEGRRVATKVTKKWPDAKVLVNGGNCAWPGINWVHAVASAWPECHAEAPLWFRAKNAVTFWKARRDEVRALRMANLVIANSQRTCDDLAALGVPQQMIKTIYLGSDPAWSISTAEERRQARQSLSLPLNARVICFVGALGYDDRKGFDTLLKAWCELKVPGTYLIAAGGGNAVEHWRKKLQALGLSETVRMLGFSDRVRDVYDAADLLVSPVRYEPFGLNVQEAICRGVPAIVTSNAGAAEVFPAQLKRYLLSDAEDYLQLAKMIRAWHYNPEEVRREFEPLSRKLQKRSWAKMAEEIIEVAEQRSSASAQLSAI